MEEILFSKTLWLIVHLFGVVIGAGGAFASDAMFFKSIRDHKITHVELSFLRVGSAMVWTGLAILLISGSALFLTNPAGYLSSSKFIAKMVIVLVIILNGLVFHFAHFKLMDRHAGHHFPSSDEFARKRKWILISGVISVVSWVSAIILGSLHSIDAPAAGILSGYALILIFGIANAMLFKNKILPAHKQRR